MALMVLIACRYPCRKKGAKGVDGTDGHDGVNGHNGKDGMTRIVYEDKGGKQEVATLNDGFEIHW